MTDPPVGQDFEAFRMLTGEVAHDLSNSLQIILGHACLLEMRLAGTPEAEDLAAVSAATSEAIRLTQKLMAMGFDQS